MKYFAKKIIKIHFSTVRNLPREFTDDIIDILTINLINNAVSKLIHIS